MQAFFGAAASPSMGIWSSRTCEFSKRAPALAFDLSGSACGHQVVDQLRDRAVARAFLFDEVSKVWEAVVRGDRPSVEQKARVRLELKPSGEE